MPLNIGYIGVTQDDVEVRVYYQTTGGVGPSQILRDNENGRALEVINPSNRTGTVVLLTADGTEVPIPLEPGTFGRTRNEMRTLGFQRRGDVGMQSPILDPITP